MKKSALFFILALFSRYARAEDETPATATSTEIRIPLDVKGNFDAISVNIDLKNPPADGPKFENISLTISLDSSDTFLFNNCPLDGATKQLDLFKIDPIKDFNPATIKPLNYLEVDVLAFDSKADLVLDPKYFKVSDVQITQDCKARKTSKMELYYGTLGMGFAQKSINNFIGDSKCFALDLWTDNGVLVLNPNVDSSVVGNHVYNITTDENWRINGEFKLGIKNSSNDTGPLTVLFNMDFDDIIVPKSIYELITSTLLDYGLTRTGNTGTERAFDYKGVFADLPTINLTLHDDLIFKLEPGDYADHESVFKIKLYIAGQDVAQHKLIGKYTDKHIVVGRNYLTKYFTVFNTTTKSISFYENSAARLEMDKKMKEFNALMKAVATGILIASLLFLFIGAYLYLKPRANKNQNEAENNETNVTESKGEYNAL